MNRTEYKQHHYTDELDGPSPLQIVGNEKAFKDLNVDQPTVFEKERSFHEGDIENQVKTLSVAKGALYA